jgi:N-methylhydantoinase B/oxoprolinase/acetone carboxylase alpha subunit
MTYTNPGPSVTTGSTNLGFGSPITIGTDEDSLVGFYGETPVDQPASASQAAVTTSATATTTVLRAQLTATAVLANALRSALVELGLIKGAA